MTFSPNSTRKLIIAAFVGPDCTDEMAGAGREPSYVIENRSAAVLLRPAASRAAPAAMSTSMAPSPDGLTSNA